MRTLDKRPYFYPANLSKGFDRLNGDLCELSIGEDLRVVVRIYDKPTNDFENASTRIEVYDCDGNFINTMGNFATGQAAMATLPAMIPVIQALHPSHVFCPEEEAAT